MSEVFGFADKRVAIKLRDYAQRLPVETVPERLYKRQTGPVLTPFLLAEDAKFDEKTVKAFVGEFYENNIIRSAIDEPVDLYNTHGCLAASDTKLSRAGRPGLMIWGGDGYQVAALYGCDSECAGAPTITLPDPIPEAKAGDPYTLPIVVTGSASSSNVFGLPDGLSYIGTGTGGNVSGTPTEPKTYWVQIRATGNCAVTKLIQLVVT